MNRKYAIKQPDGSVSILEIIHVEQEPNTWKEVKTYIEIQVTDEKTGKVTSENSGEFTTEQVEIVAPKAVQHDPKKEVEKAGMSGQSYRRIYSTKLPANRKFRDAWTDDNPTDTIDVNPNKARDIIRVKRNRSLEELDNKAIKEARKPDSNLAAIDVEAQRLRDIPQHADFNSINIDKLELLWDDSEARDV